MVFWPRLVGDGISEASLTAVPQGFVFSTPSPWIYGPRQHYLVGEMQKDEIVATWRRSWPILILFAVLLALGTAAFAAAFYSWRPPVMPRGAFQAALAGICILTCIIPCVVTNLCYRRLFRSVLAGAPYATQNVEGLTNMLTGMLPTRILVSAAVGAFTVIPIVVYHITVTGIVGPYAFFFLIVMSTMAIYYVAHMTKLGRKLPPLNLPWWRT